MGSVTVAVQPSNIVVGTKTLTPGASTVTVNGTPVSLGTDVLVVGTRTETFSADLTSASGGLGGIILSGLGGRSTAGPTSLTIEPFRGLGSKGTQRSVVLHAIVIFIVWVLH